MIYKTECFCKAKYVNRVSPELLVSNVKNAKVLVMYDMWWECRIHVMWFSCSSYLWRFTLSITKGKCVASEQCCRKNERYKTYGSTCVETCNGKPAFCTDKYVAGYFYGCSDYVPQNNSTSSPCIHSDECPKAYAQDNWKNVLCKLTI
jgi:hypothetical protein